MQMMGIRKVLAGLSVLVLFAGGAAEAQITWTDETGGAFQDADNWSGSVPGTGDTALFNLNASYTVTFSASVTNNAAQFYAPGGTVTLAIGAGKVYRAHGAGVKICDVAKPASVVVSSGTFEGGGEFHIGADDDDNEGQLTVSGAGTLVQSTLYDFYVGRHGDYNTLIITNGGEVATPRTIRIGDQHGTNNTVLIHGSGSLMSAPVIRDDPTLIVGGGGDNNTFRLEGGGAFISSNSNGGGEVIVGAGGDNNAIFVGPGCVFTNLAGVTIGDAGDDNTLTISNGHMYAKGTCRVGESGDGNTATIKAGGDWQIPNHLWIGEDAGADGNTVTVTGSGSTLNVSSYDLYVGINGATNLLAIEDGGSVIAGRNTYVGSGAGATNNTLRVEGGSFQCTRAASDGVTYVQNGSTFASHGTNGTINLRQIRVLTSSTLDFRVDADGVTPITCSNSATFDNTTRLNVDAEGLQSAGGGTVTLMTFSSKTQDILAGNITTQPAGCVVTQNATSITVEVPGPSGTVVSIK